MYAVEFSTRIRNGTIEIPEEYQERLRRAASNEQVRVIVLTAERNAAAVFNHEQDLIERLLAAPLQVPDFIPLSRDKAPE